MYYTFHLYYKTYDTYLFIYYFIGLCTFYIIEK